MCQVLADARLQLFLAPYIAAYRHDGIDNHVTVSLLNHVSIPCFRQVTRHRSFLIARRLSQQTCPYQTWNCDHLPRRRTPMPEIFISKFD